MNSTHVKTFFDVGSAGTMIGAIAGWLPSISALFTIVWMAIRIYETRTVRRLLGKREE